MVESKATILMLRITFPSLRVVRLVEAGFCGKRPSGVARAAARSMKMPWTTKSELPNRRLDAGSFGAMYVESRRVAIQPTRNEASETRIVSHASGLAGRLQTTGREWPCHLQIPISPVNRHKDPGYRGGLASTSHKDEQNKQ